jgi:hypothetical protein
VKGETRRFSREERGIKKTTDTRSKKNQQEIKCGQSIERNEKERARKLQKRNKMVKNKFSVKVKIM